LDNPLPVDLSVAVFAEYQDFGVNTDGALMKFVLV